MKIEDITAQRAGELADYLEKKSSPEFRPAMLQDLIDALRDRERQAHPPCLRIPFSALPNLLGLDVLSLR